MQNRPFASPREIRQFFTTLLTAIIVVTFYHIGNAVMDYLKNDHQLKFTIMHCCGSHENCSEE